MTTTDDDVRWVLERHSFRIDPYLRRPNIWVRGRKHSSRRFVAILDGAGTLALTRARGGTRRFETQVADHTRDTLDAWVHDALNTD